MWRRAARALAVAAAACPSAGARATHYSTQFVEGEPLELRVYLSDVPMFSGFNDSGALVWHETGIPYSAAMGEHRTAIDVPMTDRLRANASHYIHLFLSRAGASPDPYAAAYDRWATSALALPLVVYDERRKPLGLTKLLTGEPAPWEVELRRGLAADPRGPGGYISYWKGAVHAQLVIDTERHEIGNMPMLYERYLRAHRHVSGSQFKPLLYNNELTVMRMHWIAVNESSATLPLEVTLRPLPLSRFQWMVNLQHSFKQNEELLGVTEQESEEMRGMFVNTNPTLLYTTIFVSALHLLFDVLAFKNGESQPTPASRSNPRLPRVPTHTCLAFQPTPAANGKRSARRNRQATPSPRVQTSHSGRAWTRWRDSPRVRSSSTKGWSSLSYST